MQVTSNRNFWREAAERASGLTLNATANLQSKLQDLKKLKIPF